MPTLTQRGVIFLLMEIVNGGDLRVIDEVCAEHIVWHGGDGAIAHGLAAVRAHFAPLLAAIPDLTLSVEDLIGEGDRVACRFTWRGTVAAAPGATGRRGGGGGMALFRLAGDRIVECWWQGDDQAFAGRLPGGPVDTVPGPRPLRREAAA